MKTKNINLEWYVLSWDFNTKKVVTHNILKNIKDDLIKEIKNKHIYDKSILKEYLKTVFIYEYWGKTEMEMLIGDLFTDDCEKIDIWRQIEPNLNTIVEYINMKLELNFK